MEKLIFGKNNQVRFSSKEEKQEAINYLINTKNVAFVHEDNQEQGAWSSEERIQFYKLEEVPECLIRNMTKGVGNIEGRINCKEFIDEINKIKDSHN